MQPCNCRSCRSVLSRLDAVMSTADSIWLSSLPFFFLSPRPDFHTNPKLWNPLILSALLFPFLPLPSSCFSNFLGNLTLPVLPVRSDGADSKEADVTAKQLHARGGFLLSFFSWYCSSLSAYLKVKVGFLSSDTYRLCLNDLSIDFTPSPAAPLQVQSTVVQSKASFWLYDSSSESA